MLPLSLPDRWRGRVKLSANLIILAWENKLPPHKFPCSAPPHHSLVGHSFHCLDSRVHASYVWRGFLQSRFYASTHEKHSRFWWTCEDSILDGASGVALRAQLCSAWWTSSVGSTADGRFSSSSPRLAWPDVRHIRGPEQVSQGRR
jgi:hypothetical protein